MQPIPRVWQNEVGKPANTALFVLHSIYLDGGSVKYHDKTPMKPVIDGRIRQGQMALVVIGNVTLAAITPVGVSSLDRYFHELRKVERFTLAA